VAEIRYRRILVQADVYKTRLTSARRKLAAAQLAIGKISADVPRTGATPSISVIARRRRRERCNFSSEPTKAHSPSVIKSHQEELDDDFWE
jgi:hypothetical protein